MNDDPKRLRPHVTAGSLPLTDTYVQTVPDKCDRIVWRNDYYHLPLPKDGWRLEGPQGGPIVAVLYGDPEPEGTYPEDDPRSHNCDAMGCGSYGPHVLRIVPLHDAPPRAGLGGEWREVENELPPLDTPVWLHLKHGSIIQGERNDSGDGWLWANSYNSAYVDKDGKWKSEPEMDDDYEVTHWMHLPPPPAADDRGV